jgi:hypothetical protein
LICDNPNCESCMMKDGNQVCNKCVAGYSMDSHGSCSSCNSFFEEISESCQRDKDVPYYLDYC